MSVQRAEVPWFRDSRILHSATKSKYTEKEEVEEAREDCKFQKVKDGIGQGYRFELIFE